MKKLALVLLTLLAVDATAATPGPAAQPNIVWIVAEDISPFIGAYGYAGVKTPNIDRLAREGVRYDLAFTTAGVCAPSRSAIITGMYQTSIGTQHMRTKSVDPKFMGKGVPNYDAVIPADVRLFPEYLRVAGYYTTNNEKQDYQFNAPVTVWDENGPAASYRNRPAGKPFFSVHNLFITHEANLTAQKNPLQVDPAGVSVPPYYQDTPTTRRDIARMLTNIETMDAQVGTIVQRLKDDGLYDDTIIFFYADNGGTLPWMKREVLERGLHIPLIVRMPGKQAAAGSVNKELVSAVDFAPTILSLAGIPIPSFMQGQAFLGPQKARKARQYVFGARDRMDDKYDRARSVRDARFQYIYNYMPDQPAYQDLSYRYPIPMMKEMLELRDAGALNPVAMSWFKPTKDVEELYDLESDPHQLHNLAADPAYRARLVALRAALRDWTAKYGDMGAIPEQKMVADWWQGQPRQPATATPEFRRTADGVVVACATPGAALGYRIVREGEAVPEAVHVVDTFDMQFTKGAITNGSKIPVAPSWKVYTGGPIALRKGERLLVNAMRIGFAPATASYLEP